jgi:hypothetical protein
MMRLAAGAATADIAYHAGERRAHEGQAGAADAPRPAQDPPARAVDTTAELERLAALHQSGELDDAEFVAAKQRVLGL